ncbi:MAG: winged helix-turn-helix domain-containing protein [Pyrinomonadaceae bacterium]|nr:winged helix-turn-helix domain-containing protein [Pyrinomonadaceae bacterium]
MTKQPKDIYEFGPFCLDTRERVLLRDGRPLPLKPKVYETLVALVSRSGHVVDKEELMKRVWPDVVVEENNLTGNIFALRRAFAEHQYIETVPRRGYRFTANVKQVTVEDLTILGRSGAETEVLIKETITTTRKVINSLAVLPFINANADPEAEYLSDGITESIINNLSQLSRLRVMSRASVFRYKDREADPQEIGRELNVCAVLLGRVLQFSERLIIRTELVDVESGGQLWGEQYNRKPVDIFAVQEEIASEISETLRLKLRDEEKLLLTKRYTQNTEAYHAYLRGRYFWNKRTEDALKKAIDYFQQAIVVDQNYALAYAGLADCYAVLGNFNFLSPQASYPQAKTAAVKALEIDDTLAEAHASLAWVKTQYDWDWPGAERKFKQAIELNPGYTPARYWYALLLSAMGRHQEAITESKRAQEIEPLGHISNTVLGWVLYFARQYDESLEQLQRTVEIEPNFSFVSYHLGMTYEQKGMFAEALEELNRAINSQGSRLTALAVLGHAYAVSGERDAALKVLKELQGASRQKYVAPFCIALVYTGLGENEQAFAWLEKACDVRSWGLLWLKVDPRFDRLRPDTRFAALLDRIGLVR